MIRAASVLLALALASSAAAGEFIFRWVDTKGDLHVTDRLGDVPEPYYSMYAAELRRLEEERAKGKGKARPAPHKAAPAPASDAPRGPSIVDQEIARQKHWKDLVAQWRKELATATSELEAIDAELAQANLNPILRTTPPVKAKIAEIEARRAAALEKVEAARKMLLETIPERARKEQVPPKWLM